MLAASSRSTWLITGATGFIGSRLTSLALERGLPVRTLTRSDWATPPAVPIDQRFLGSLPGSIPPEALKGVRTVVHCAVEVGDQFSRAWAVNVDGTLNLARLALGEGVESFIFLSSQSAREDAVSAYGRTKYAAEQALKALPGLRIVILRPGLVTGPGTQSLFFRMSRLVEKLPVIPLLGGGRSIVQPIHVDDVCTAVFRAAENSSDLDRQCLNLGDPSGVSLVEFLQAIARVQLRHRKMTLSVPIGPMEAVTAVAEALRLPFPVSRSNLKGMKSVARMDTEADMARLGLDTRPLEELVRRDTGPRQDDPGMERRAVRALLVGAGRIGLVHAITLSRLKGLVLVGVVDSNPGARRLLAGLGVKAPMFGSVEEAIRASRPDAAVIATPAASHLPLCRTCLSSGLSVLVEKPLAVREEQLQAYRTLVEEFPGLPLQVGYLMPGSPHIASSLDRLRAGEFGKVIAFEGLTLLSLIQDSGTRRWEVQRAVSGGGVLINAGGHVLSLIRSAFGDPDSVQAQSAKLFSAEVEDTLVATFHYRGFDGVHYCSWSIDGFPRQENRLTVFTDEGRLVVTPALSAFVSKDGGVSLFHALDFDTGFNLLPDYGGGGFSTELADLARSTRSRQPAPMNIAEATRLEQVLFRIYEESQAVTSFQSAFTAPPPWPSPPPRLENPSPSVGSDPVQLVLDLRSLSSEQTLSYLERPAKVTRWDEFQLNPEQVRNLSADLLAGGRLRVTVPDFLHQTRLLSTGRIGSVLRQMGASGVLSASRAGISLLPREKSPTFWVAAMGLLGAALHSVPRGFRGTMLLHGYLTDFSLSLRRLDVLERMLVLCRKRHPDVRIGIHTNLASEALNALRLLDVAVDDVSLLSSPAAIGLTGTLAGLRQAGGCHPIRVTAEVGPAPAVVHHLAFAEPGPWAHGADAVLVGIEADSELWDQRRREAAQDWAKAFPGIPLPEEPPS